ncbi:uncharacterized protein LOC127249328 [Andrographis paniculata]|uniref:uncharacterized protein LOC127249328 n=1 Tax=Andrographis paniculata TaxID=175694 RepID=UPI0021E92521|nr:uncharacterized protein LOC127249328 [Andrographis paniculata]
MMPPATGSLSRTRRRVVDSVIGKRCPICLSRVEIPSAAVIIPCLHAYCIGCIRRWSDFKRKCPLCNADFCSWLCQFDKDFREERLISVGRSTPVSSLPRDDTLLRRRRAQLFEQRRMISRASREVSVVKSRTRELPKQRSLERSSHESPEVEAERIRKWRASIYEQRLKAVPFASNSENGVVKQISANDGGQERILRKIEPWIRRELQAILGDPDPTVIVHVVTSIFILIYKKKQESFLGQIEDDYLAPLRRFLGDQTELFWHELRCFAESSFTMNTYDTIVVYKVMD